MNRDHPNPVFSMIRVKAREILREVIESPEWDSLKELRDLVERMLTKYLVKHHPTCVVDFLEVREVTLHREVTMYEFDLDIIQSDRPSLWGTALLMETAGDD